MRTNSGVCARGRRAVRARGPPLSLRGLARSHRLCRRRNYGPLPANIKAGGPESTGNILQQHTTPPLTCPSHFFSCPASSVGRAATPARRAHLRESCPLARARGCITRRTVQAKHSHSLRKPLFHSRQRWLGVGVGRPGGGELSPHFFPFFSRPTCTAGNLQSTAHEVVSAHLLWGSAYFCFLVAANFWLLPFCGYFPSKAKHVYVNSSFMRLVHKTLQ